jgi:hypothetical protein
MNTVLKRATEGQKGILLSKRSVRVLIRIRFIARMEENQMKIFNLRGTQVKT